MSIEIISEHRCFEGIQGYYRHRSETCDGEMRFSVYSPPQARLGLAPVVYCLAGLTCTDETFAIKAGAQRYAAELGLILVCPDTSPRDTGIEGATGDWEFGEGAGFYLDATQPPWSAKFRMRSYVVDELPRLVEDNFSADKARRGIMGHSMGGHGALTIALTHPDRYRSVSAFAPIAAPSQVPWGLKAMTHFLGSDRATWRDYDSCELLDAGHRFSGTVLVDQGLGDTFINTQLKPDLLEAACQRAGQSLQLNRHGGYDHGYFFISSFVQSHLQHHAQALGSL